MLPKKAKLVQERSKKLEIIYSKLREKHKNLCMGNFHSVGCKSLYLCIVHKALKVYVSKYMSYCKSFKFKSCNNFQEST